MKKETTELPAPMLLTVTQARRKKRDLEMLTDYVGLLKEDPTRSRLAVNDHLMRKYEISSNSGYYTALKRALADSDTPRKIVADYNRLQGIK